VATGCTVTSISARDESARAGGYRVETSDGPIDADRVILAVPAAAAARLIEPHCPSAASELRSIRHASVALALLSYPASSFPRPLPGSGVLVPRTEGRLMTACSCGSAKWPDWAEPGSVVLRVSAGRVDDARPAELDDDALISQLHAELQEMLGVSQPPAASRVARWPDAFPQYEVGHLDRVTRIERALLVDLPGVVVAGAAFRGVGLPACIAQGRSAASRVMDVEQERPPSVPNF
jgi:oxygen-dependent protoporphyrinogen oxidase